MKNNFKLPLTIFGIYEVIVILLLSFEDLCINTICLFSRHHYCELCEYHGFQYILLCLLIPTVLWFLWWWRKELAIAVLYIKKHKPMSKLFSKLLGFKFFDILFGEYKEISKDSVSKNANKKRQKYDKNEEQYGWQDWD